MATVVLINFDEDLAARFTSFLRFEHYEVLVASRFQPFDQLIRAHQMVPELLIIDASGRDAYVRDLLGRIASYHAKHGPLPLVLCVLRAYRGPEFQVELERKGARVIYVC